MRDFSDEEFEAEGIDAVEFTDGFNWGYLLAETHEDVVKGMLDDGIESPSDHSKGFEQGAREWFREKEAERAEELDSLRGKDQDKGRDLER